MADSGQVYSIFKKLCPVYTEVKQVDKVSVNTIFSKVNMGPIYNFIHTARYRSGLHCCETDACLVYTREKR